MNAPIDELMDEYVSALRGSIRSSPVEAALRKVPRHRLLKKFYVYKKEYESGSGFEEIDHDPKSPTEEHLRLIYSNRALPIRISNDGLPTSSTSEPGLVAQMLELLELEPGLRVLEIGTGTGYNAALMSELVRNQKNMVTIDIQEDVVADAKELLADAGFGQIPLLARDGFFGAHEWAPYHRIAATVACPDLSPHWVEQLDGTGFMLIPLSHGGSQPLTRVWKEEGTVRGKVVGISGFMDMGGELKPRSRSDRASEKDKEVKTIPIWPDFEQRFDLWFFLGIIDKRTSLLSIPGGDPQFDWLSWNWGLADGPARVVLGQDVIHVVGDESLLSDLNRGYERWIAAGSPTVDDFLLRFDPLEAHSGNKSDLAVDRQYFRETFEVG